MSYIFYALFLRNLVSGYECGRVFPAGVGPGSPSRNAANWLPSRFSLTVETRWRYDWLGMVFPSARLFQAPIWCLSGGMTACERQGALSRRAWSRSIGWVRTRFGESGRRFDRRRARKVLNLCAQESKARTGRLLREKLMSDYGYFSSYEDQQEAANEQDSWAFFRYAQGFGRLDACSHASFTSSRSPPHWTSVFHFSLFRYDVWP